MKITIDTIYTYVDFEGDTILQEKVQKFMHKALGVKEDGVIHSPSYKKGFWDGITDFYDAKEDRFHTGLLQQFIRAIGEMQNKTPNITYTIEDIRPEKIMDGNDIEDEIVLGDEEVGSITLRDYQHDSVKAIFDESIGIVNISTNGGKCVSYNEHLLTSEGTMTVKDFFNKAGHETEDKEDVVPYNGKINLINRFGKEENPSHLTFNGMRELKEIKGHRGTKNTITNNHPLLTVSEDGTFQWKEAKNIQVGDIMVGRIGDNVYGSNNLVDKEEAYSLGAIVADGYIGQETHIGFTSNKPEVAEFLRKYLTSLAVREDYELYTETGQKNADQFKLHDSKAVRRWHEKFDIAYGVAKHKHVPQCIMESPKDIQVAFLSGYFESECNISPQKGCIDVISASHTLVNQINLMLRNMGYVPSVREKVVKGYEQNDYYVLSLGSTDSISLIKQLGFISDNRKSQVDKLMGVLLNRSRNNKKEPVPHGKKLTEKYYKSYDKKDRPKGMNKDFSVPRTISKTRLRKAITKFPDGDTDLLKTIEQLVDENYVFEEVVEINDLPPEPTFDVCMPETHSFIAEGIVNHNTEVAAGAMQQVLPKLRKGERIAFFTDSKEIFHQSAERIKQRLYLEDKDIGKIGDGKFDVKNKQIVFVMIPTLNSSLKDPKKGVKFTPKERVIKHIAEEVAPKFKNATNTRNLLRRYIDNCKLTTKVWQSAEEQLMYIAYDKKFNDKTAKMQLNKYQVELDKIIEKKNKKKFEKYKKTKDFVDSVKVLFADECLTGEALVTLPDGGWKRIKEIDKGEMVKGGEVSNLVKREVPTVEVRAKNTLLEGSPTHPTYVVKSEDVSKFKEGVSTERHFQEVPLMSIKKGDYLPISKVFPHTEKNKWTPTQLSFVAMIMADGHIDKDTVRKEGGIRKNNRVKVNVSRDEDWYLEKFTEGVHSFNPDAKVKSSRDCRGNLTVWTTDKEVKEVLVEKFDIPIGKKSSTIVINEQIQYAPLESLQGFISTYFSCEGDLSGEYKGDTREHTSYRLFASTVSREFSLGMLNLMKKFGIVGTLQVIHRKKDNHSTVYRIGLSGTMFNLYMDKIGVIDRKGLDKRNYGETPFISVGDFVLSKVNGIEFKDEVQEVYDFTTTTHTFEANGALTHNCHHGKADTWFNSLSLCENAVLRTGMTGTVDKSDKMGWQRLQALFGQVSIRITNDFLIEKGISSRPSIRIVNIKEPKDLELVSDYQTAYTKGIVENDVRNQTISKLVEGYKKHKPGGVLISTVYIEHGNRIMELLHERGIHAEFIHGESEEGYRKDTLQRFSRGEIDVLVASTIIDEGVDLKSIGCLVLAAGGKSMRQQLQRIGRALRLNGIDGNKVVIFDFMDMTNKHLKKHSKERLKIYEAENFDVKELGK